MPVGRTSPVVAILLVLLIGFADGSSEFPRYRRHIRLLVDRVNEFSGPFVGLVMAYRTEAASLESSGEFVPARDVPRRFHVGTICRVPVIWVMSGERRLNAGITVQILLDHFDIWGIVHYGIAGGADDSLSFGDVSIPRFVAFTGSWTWKRFKSADEEESKEELALMKIGAFNIPEKGKNLLSSLEFKPEEFFAVGEEMKKVFWMETFPPVPTGQKLQDLELDQCVNATYCLPIHRDIFVDNAAYRRFLSEKFNVSTVDEESAAVIMAAMSPGTPAIAIRGVSDMAGGGTAWPSTALNSFASANAFKAAVKFIELIGSCGRIVGGAAGSVEHEDARA
ncbi:unnamed protein product [Spirodela intermedia]|uniref:Nucleoside phosphorylase domain-containing protein n=1 Tax=Spirodela intermedia TaxID=51605 RepID=A0A7I8JHI6_SPIIN|nr:unnamed protein product [Spirodela intermedia]CAA6669629.1 unnamed protein product [Spirodela intermedia]